MLVQCIRQTTCCPDPVHPVETLVRYLARSSSLASGAGAIGRPFNGRPFNLSPCLDSAILQPLQWSELGALDALIDRCGEAEDGWTVHTLSRGLVNWPTIADRALIGLTCELDDHARLVGVAAVAPAPSQRLEAHVSVLVDPRCRRRGFGSLLFDAILRFAAAQGYQAVSARTHDANSDCVRLLLRHGFMLSCRPGPESLLLTRRLDDVEA